MYNTLSLGICFPRIQQFFIFEYEIWSRNNSEEQIFQVTEDKNEIEKLYFPTENPFEFIRKIVAVVH